jgi:hypothetical protein
MKTSFLVISILLAATLSSCGILNLMPNNESITPSANRITEKRDVSGFAGIDMRAFGKVTIRQGDHESLVLEGSDNLLPLVKTKVENGVLVIEIKENINVETLKKDNILSFAITVKDLNNITVSGLGEVDMEALNTKDLQLTMSGAGFISFGKLTADHIRVNVSGLGNINVSGTARLADVEISGAGEVNAADLKCQSIHADVPGLGTAVVWVTDKLTGTISGAGSVRYYGKPQTSTNTTGLGRFEALGDK